MGHAREQALARLRHVPCRHSNGAHEQEQRRATCAEQQPAQRESMSVGRGGSVQRGARSPPAATPMTTLALLVTGCTLCSGRGARRGGGGFGLHPHERLTSTPVRRRPPCAGSPAPSPWTAAPTAAAPPVAAQLPGAAHLEAEVGAPPRAAASSRGRHGALLAKGVCALKGERAGGQAPRPPLVSCSAVQARSVSASERRKTTHPCSA